MLRINDENKEINLRAGTLQGGEGLVNFNYTLFIIFLENTK